VSVTLYVRGLVKVWVIEGWLPVLPSSKFHAHAVGFPVDVLVKVTSRGAGPDVGVAVKLAASPLFGNVTSSEKALSFPDVSYALTAMKYCTPSVRPKRVCVVTVLLGMGIGAP
jgi:hypothetical protein